jgi:eukaryotic-like serine/threonine-protein kinase
MELTPFHGPPAAVPQIPGVCARTLLGFGAHGEVWLADDLTTGAPVAVKIGRSRPGEPDGDEALTRETALLARIRHPHVVRLQRVVHVPGGSLALVLDLAAGGSLASLVAARGPLDPGEVSTVVIPLADALEHLHGRGLAHGDISPGNVLFTDDGRPQLGDLGVGRLLGARVENVWSTPGFTAPAAWAGDGADPRAADLWGLAALGWFALTGQPPPPDAGSGAVGTSDDELRGLLGRVLSANPAAQPSLAEFAASVREAARPVPVRLVTEVASLGLDVGLPPLSRVTRRVLPTPTAVPVGPPSEPPRQRRRVMTALTLAATGLLLGGLAVLAGPELFAGPTPGPARSPTVSPPEQARVALDRIGAARATAFRTLSIESLASAEVPGSTAERSDRALVQRLRGAGYRLDGVRYRLSGLQVVRRAGASMVVRASVTTSAHRRVGVGRESALVPPDGPRPVVFTLVASGSAPGWRVSDVEAGT